MNDWNKLRQLRNLLAASVEAARAEQAATEGPTRCCVRQWELQRAVADLDECLRSENPHSAAAHRLLGRIERLLAGPATADLN